MSKCLSREYFNKGWEIINHEPDETGFVLWEAKWNRSYEKGDGFYADLTVTNIMYKEQFCIDGSSNLGRVVLRIYTTEDLENVLKVLGIYKYYSKKKEL